MEERAQELAALQAIYPEELIVDTHVPDHAYLDIPLNLEEPLVLRDAQDLPFKIHHLLLLQLELTLSPTYPFDTPPKTTLSASPSWLSPEFIRDLEKDAACIWERDGRVPTLLSYFSHIQEKVTLAARSVVPTLSYTMTKKLRDCDQEIKQKQFEKQTFKCGVCLGLEKGSLCYSMECCSAVFCIVCLREFYNTSVQENRIAEVKCLSPECEATKRDQLLGPRPLLALGIDSAIVQKFVDKKRRMAMETDQSTVWCPRSWCSGAAKSARHPKVTIADTGQVSWETEVTPEEDIQPHSYQSTEHDMINDRENSERSKRRLAICSDCNFAFCTLCNRSWHGKLNPCSMPTEEELRRVNSAASIASVQYIYQHVARCPKCRTPYMRISGCDHMKCTRCGTRFCYNCWGQLSGPPSWDHLDGYKCRKMVTLELRVVDEGHGEVWALQDSEGP